jgi:N-succinyldiaminopimelate aminotransferase
VNPLLPRLQPYPFERLRALLAGVTPPASLRPIRLSIGEPQHPTPPFIRDALASHLDGLAVYPTTAGSDRLRDVIARWFVRRYNLPALDPAADVLPINGTREALFAFAQAVIDPSRTGPLVACPNPFYQIYEGAALLAGASTALLNQTESNAFALDTSLIPEERWRQVQLLYACSPGNPTGRVLTIDEWRRLFELSDAHGFVIASDECYSDIYPPQSPAPIGGLEAAARLGRTDFRNLVVFVSLSKRSNAPGLRSGAVAGDRALLESFLLYRTYHGSAMGPAVQQASIAAWSDEAHVAENRRLYQEKFQAVVPLLAGAVCARRPDAGFYLWARVPGGDDELFTRDLFAVTGVTVLPGQYLSRSVDGFNPGRGYVRMALVPELGDCVEAAGRIARFCAGDSVIP